MLNVAVIGAAGRMGKSIIRLAGENPEIRITAAVEWPGHPEIGKDSGEISDVPANGVNLSGSLDTLNGADTVIDFALHDAIPDHVEYAANHGIAMVIGTTGLSEDEKKVVIEAGQKIPIVHAPNMSLGVNLLISLIGQAADLLPPEYRIELSETHHVHKKDAPSGTALRLAEEAAMARMIDPENDVVHEQTPDPSQILVTSERRGEVVGDHSMAFKSKWEEIVISHHAISRDTFAMGALRAAQWLPGKKPGVYDMQDVLGLRA